MRQSLVSRSLSSIAWQSVANWGNIFISFFQSVYLTRNLEISIFGQYAFAASIVTLVGTVSKFGSGAAFTYRSEFTEDETAAAQSLQTHQLITVGITASILVLIALTYFENDTFRLAVLVLTGGQVFNALLLRIPRLMLMRRVVHRRIALVDLCANYASAFVAIAWTYFSPTIWALLAATLTKRVIVFIGFYVWKPFWIPRLRWDRDSLAYYFRFGGRNLISETLLTLLDRADDLWIGTFLGDVALGIYSRAYRFATYPRQIVAYSVNMVILGTYAEIIDNRIQVSKAFFRTNGFLIRTSFLMGGLLSLAIPEFVALVLTDKWAGMIPVFRLMLVFTLLDPLKKSVSNIFIAAGRPEIVTRARIVQLCTLLLGLMVFYLATDLEIIGAALSVNLMLLVGIAILLVRVRQFVDYSVVALFLGPSLALLIGFGWVVIGLQLFPGLALWQSGLLKIVVYPIVYIGTLLLFEYRSLKPMIEAYIPTIQKRLGRLTGK